MSNPTATSPLAGMTVVEIGTVITAPLASRLLAEFGATVIKIERPGNGDTFRSFTASSQSPLFQAFNKSKKSVVLDLKDAGDLSKLQALINSADVLVENFRPGVMDRMGLTWDRLHKDNPRLVYLSITGFGKDGPYCARPSFDTVTLALSGIAASQLEPDRPRFTGPTLSDNVTGMYAALGIMGALIERQTTGKGRRIEVSMLDASIAFIPDLFTNYLTGVQLTPYSRAKFSQCFAGACQDGKLLAIHLSSQDKFWHGLIKVLDRPDLMQDQRFTRRMDRTANYDAVSQLVATSLPARPRLEWMQRLEAEDVPFAPVNSIPDVFEDPQTQHSGIFHRPDGADAARQFAVYPPYRFDGQRLRTPAPAPALGADTASVLASLEHREGESS